MLKGTPYTSRDPGFAWNSSSELLFSSSVQSMVSSSVSGGRFIPISRRSPNLRSSLSMTHSKVSGSQSCNKFFLISGVIRARIPERGGAEGGGLTGPRDVDSPGLIPRSFRLRAALVSGIANCISEDGDKKELVCVTGGCLSKGIYIDGGGTVYVKMQLMGVPREDEKGKSFGMPEGSQNAKRHFLHVITYFQGLDLSHHLNGIK